MQNVDRMFPEFSISSTLGQEHAVDSEDPFVIPRPNGKQKPCLYKEDLTAYLVLMKDCVQGVHHPTIEMFDQLWEEDPKDHSRANHPATVNVPPSPAPQPVARDPELLEAFKAMQAKLQEMKQTLANHTLPNSLNEVSQCHTELTLREKEHSHLM